MVPGYSAVIFDLFWTLTSLEAAGVGGPQTYELLGVPRERWGPVWERTQDDRVQGRYRSNVELLAAVAEELELGHEPTRWAEVIAVRRGRFRQALLAVEPAVLAALAELRTHRLKLGLLSDADCDEVAAWPDSPLRPLFDAALFSCHEGFRKPAPAFYLRLCERLEVDPRRCLYVGDGGSDEHLGARQVGMTPVLITDHLRRFAPERIPLAARRCDHVVTEVRELLALATAERVERG